MKIIKTKLFNHQKDAYKFSIKRKNSALLMEQGTGKTLPSIKVAGRRYLKGEINKLLIVAPLSVLYEWQRQFEEHANFPYDFSIKKLSFIDKEGLKVTAINYDYLWRIEKEILKWKPDMIIADESQYIKNRKSKRAKALYKIGSKSEYRMILTGTPMTQNPLDFFGQYKFLKPEIFGTNFKNFKDRYAVFGGYMNYKIVDYKNLKELTRKAYKVAYRVTKEEALDLPEKIDQYVYANLEKSAQKYYNEMKEESIIKIKDEYIPAPVVLTQLLRLQQITGGFIPTEDEIFSISKAKLKALEDIMEDRKPYVIFAKFRPEIDAISDMLKLKKIKHRTLTGSTKDRGKVIEDFQSGKADVLVAQIAAGGVGLTLTKANTAIFYSLDYSLINYEQAKARIHRIGQNKKVNYIHIIVPKTVDELVLKSLKKKRDLAHMVVDELRALIFQNKETELLKEVTDNIDKDLN